MVGGKLQPHIAMNEHPTFARLSEAQPPAPLVEELGPDEMAFAQRVAEEARILEMQREYNRQAMLDQGGPGLVPTIKASDADIARPFRRLVFQSLAMGAAVVSDQAMRLYEWAQDRADDSI